MAVMKIKDAVGDNLRTDIKDTELKAFLKLANTINMAKLETISLYSTDDKPAPLMTTGTINKISYVLPTAGVGNYGNIRAYIKRKFSAEPFTAENAQIAVAFCILFGSCTTTQYVPVIENHTDTLIQTKVLRDSVWLHDSIHVMERGDTMLIEKWHTRYVTKETHDTTYVSKTDSVPVPYPVEVQVPAELTWWQQTRLHLANVLLWALLIAGAGWLLKKKLWR